MALLMLAEGRGTKQALQSILGSLGYPLSVKKICLYVFGSSYRWVDSLRDKKVFPIPWQVRQEILMASLLLSCATADLRSQISTHLHFSDATPSTGGVVSGVGSRRLAEALHGICETRGKHARLDWVEEDFLARG